MLSKVDMHIINNVGNAVPGVPSGAVRKHRARSVQTTAAFGGRNAGDGVPYKGAAEKVDNTTSVARIIAEPEIKCKERNREFTNASHPGGGGVVYLSRRKE